MTYGFSIKLKRGVPSRTKIRTELPLVLSYPAHISTDIVCSGLFPGKGSGHSRFLSVVIIAESVADTVNFLLCYRLDKHRTLLLIYFLFIPAVTVGSAGGKVILPHGDLQRTEPLHQAAAVSFRRVFSILPQSRQKRNVFSSLKYQTNIVGISKIRFTRPAISLIIAPQS